MIVDDEGQLYHLMKPEDVLGLEDYSRKAFNNFSVYNLFDYAWYFISSPRADQPFCVFFLVTRRRRRLGERGEGAKTKQNSSRGGGVDGISTSLRVRMLTIPTSCW